MAPWAGAGVPPAVHVIGAGMSSPGSCVSVCVTGTHLPVYNWLTNTPLQVHRRCASCGQDKRAFSSLQIPPEVYQQKIPRLTSVTGKKKKRTKYRWGPQLTVVLCVVFLSPSSLWAVGQPGVVWSPPHTCQALGQDDCLGGLPSRECWIKPIPQFPDTRLFAFLECLTTAGMLCFFFFSLENRLLACFSLVFHLHKSPTF